METTTVEREGLALVTRSREFAVVDAPSYAAAGEFLAGIIKVYRRNVATLCDPAVEAAHAAHKAAVAMRKKLDAPADEAERVVKTAMLTWRAAERRRAAEAQRAADDAARKDAEARQLEEAAAAERAGDHAAAEALAAAPTFVPPVLVAPTIPKVEGISARKTWDFRVTNLAAVPREYLLLDAVKVRKIVQAMGAQTAIPGVEVFERSGINAGAR